MASNQSDSFSSMDQEQDVILPGLITLETRLYIEEVFSCGLLPVICIVGLTGNVLCLVVLGYQGTKEATNVLLIGLAITDLLFIIFSFVCELDCPIRRFSEILAMKVEALTRYYVFIPAYIIGRISSLFICLVAVERYIVVLYPLRVNSLITRKVIMLSMLGTYFVGFALGGCLLFIYDVEESFNTDLNTTVLKIAYSQYAIDNFDFLIMYLDIFLALAFRFLPVGLVLFCTFSIVRALRRSITMRNQMTGQVYSKQQMEQQKLTKMLLSICILFILCTVPGIINAIARLLFSKDGYADIGRYENVSAVVGSMIFLFSLVNSSANFILYIVTSKRFAATFRSLFK